MKMAIAGLVGIEGTLRTGFLALQGMIIMGLLQLINRTRDTMEHLKERLMERLMEQLPQTLMEHLAPTLMEHLAEEFIQRLHRGPERIS